MCGIIGYTGKNRAVPYLIKGLEALEYRGYDSSGIGVNEGGEIGFCKCTGRVSALKGTLGRKSIDAVTGIGHTRWATHGRVSTVNSHPHLSMNKLFAVVHNGIIENYEQIRKDLDHKGFSFLSDTDTEVIPNLLEQLYKGNLITAVNECVSHLEGSFAFAVLCKDYPDSIICVRRGNPLVVCQTQQGCFVSSDTTALSEYTDTVYKPEDNCPVLITPDGVEFFDSEGNTKNETPHKINRLSSVTDKKGYRHFMLKEIMEQPTAVEATIRQLLEGEYSFIKNIYSFSRIHFIACGSAYHVGLVGKYLFEKHTGISCECHIASEFRYSDVPIKQGDLCIVISQSGETADSLSAMRKAKQVGAFTLGIVNVPESSLACESDEVILTKAGPEIAVATTKAYSAQLSVIYYLCALLCKDNEKRERIINELSELPKLIERTIEMNKDRCALLSELFALSRNAYFIGRNTDYPSAMEGALKMKEISYIPCEAYAAGELKHGTISLIQKGTLVVSVMLNEDVLPKTVSNVKEVASRGAKVICITKEKKTHLFKDEPYVLSVPDCDDMFNCSLGVIVLQLLSYHTAERLGRDIDKPRNLAKSVTVE